MSIPDAHERIYGLNYLEVVLSTLKIKDLFESVLLQWAEKNNIDYTLANFPFEGSAVLHLEPFIVPAVNQGIGVSQDVTVYSGNYQINIVIKKGEGSHEGYLLAERVLSLFPNGAELSDDYLSCSVNAPASILPAIQKEDSYIIPVSISYWSQS